MAILNQLFTRKPELKLVSKIIKNIGLVSFKDRREFTIKDMEQHNAVSRMTADKSILEDLYIPCKHKLFIEDLTEKKCITICRQILKLYNYDIISTEKSVNNKKVLFYKLASLKEKLLEKKHNKQSTKKNIKKEYIIIFD